MTPVVVPQKNTPFCQQAYNNWHRLGDVAEQDGAIGAVGTFFGPAGGVFLTAGAFEGTASAFDHLLYVAFCSQ